MARQFGYFDSSFMPASKFAGLIAFFQVPAYVEMKAFGMQGFRREEGRSTVLWFRPRADSLLC
jgi:hypothetical protein